MIARQAYSPSLQLENVAVVRGNRIVLEGLSLTAGGGDVIWVRGANGCGKSTLLRLIAGLLPLLSGRTLVDGRVALADENTALDASLSVAQALRFWADMDGANAAGRETAITDMDLFALSKIPIRFLSTGQRKRANLARVVASNAPIWLLDEPYNGLDSASCARLDQTILKHVAAGGIALVAAHQSPSINVTNSLLLDRLGQSA